MYATVTHDAINAGLEDLFGAWYGLAEANAGDLAALDRRAGEVRELLDAVAGELLILATVRDKLLNDSLGYPIGGLSVMWSGDHVPPRHSLRSQLAASLAATEARS